MAEQLKAGKYEITRPNTRFKQVTSPPGKPLEYTEYKTGDVVELSAEDATRLQDIIDKPGAVAQAEADRLQAAADAAKAAADEAKAKATDAAKDAKATS